MDNIYTILKPFYFLAKILGSFPMTFEGPTVKGFLKTKRHDVLITSCVFIALTILTVYKVTAGNVIANDSFIMIKAWDLSLVFGLFAFLVHFCIQIAMRKNIKFFLRCLDNYDKEVK